MAKRRRKTFGGFNKLWKKYKLFIIIALIIIGYSIYTNSPELSEEQSTFATDISYYSGSVDWDDSTGEVKVTTTLVNNGPLVDFYMLELQPVVAGGDPQAIYLPYQEMCNPDFPENQHRQIQNWMTGEEVTIDIKSYADSSNQIFMGGSSSGPRYYDAYLVSADHCWLSPNGNTLLPPFYDGMFIQSFPMAYPFAYSSCTDSDCTSGSTNCRVYDVKGTVNYDGSSYPDTCSGDYTLKEYYCTSSQAKSYDNFGCDNLGVKYYCKLGACRQSVRGNNICEPPEEDGKVDACEDCGCASGYTCNTGTHKCEESTTPPPSEYDVVVTSESVSLLAGGDIQYIGTFKNNGAQTIENYMVEMQPVKKGGSPQATVDITQGVCNVASPENVHRFIRNLEPGKSATVTLVSRQSASNPIFNVDGEYDIYIVNVDHCGSLLYPAIPFPPYDYGTKVKTITVGTNNDPTISVDEVSRACALGADDKTYYCTFKLKNTGDFIPTYKVLMQIDKKSESKEADILTITSDLCYGDAYYHKTITNFDSNDEVELYLAATLDEDHSIFNGPGEYVVRLYSFDECPAYGDPTYYPPYDETNDIASIYEEFTIAGCQSDTDCPTGQECKNNVCWECDTKIDCDADEICDPVTHLCYEECSTDADCTYNLISKVCDTSKKQCVECVDDEDCDDSTNDVCVDNVCEDNTNKILCGKGCEFPNGDHWSVDDSEENSNCESINGEPGWCFDKENLLGSDGICAPYEFDEDAYQTLTPHEQNEVATGTCATEYWDGDDGDDCDGNCEDDEECIDGVCVEKKECTSDDDCPDNYECENNKCEKIEDTGDCGTKACSTPTTGFFGAGDQSGEVSITECDTGWCYDGKENVCQIKSFGQAVYERLSPTDKEKIDTGTCAKDIGFQSSCSTDKYCSDVYGDKYLCDNGVCVEGSGEDCDENTLCPDGEECSSEGRCVKEGQESTLCPGEVKDLDVGDKTPYCPTESCDIDLSVMAGVSLVGRIEVTYKLCKQGEPACEPTSKKITYDGDVVSSNRWEIKYNDFVVVEKGYGVMLTSVETAAGLDTEPYPRFKFTCYDEDVTETEPGLIDTLAEWFKTTPENVKNGLLIAAAIFGALLILPMLTNLMKGLAPPPRY